MDLELIKEEKTREADEIFKEIGVEPSLHFSPDLNENYNIYPTVDGNYENEMSLYWTRLSNNSNFGCILT